MPDAGLTGHLRDAIRLNRARRAGYRRRGGLRADLLSRALVAAERALLPAARALDRAARRHAVPVLRAGLVEMDRVPSADHPMERIRPQRWGRAGGGGRPWRAVWACDFAAAASRLVAEIERERARESETGRRRALAIHLFESARLFAAHAPAHARQSGGATRMLSRRVVLGHLALVPFARVLDRLAAPVHARGVGLFVNDVPPIPEP